MRTDFTAEIKQLERDVRWREHQFVRLAELPTLEEIQRNFGRDVLRLPEAERAAFIAAKIEVIEPFWPDPAAWCKQGIDLALKEKMP